MANKVKLKIKGSEAGCCCSSGCSTVNKDVVIKNITSKLTMNDKLGALKVRLGIGRMSYKIEPGLYRLGNPDKSSEVLVTANYKLTVDILRKELDGLDLWILVLDTKGVNVWCAAGKGTFSTKELVKRIKFTGLNEIVEHNRIILPQLGATGISAHEVTKMSTFKVVYGPVRAADIKDFLQSGMKATKEMRTVNFTLKDRLILTPIELLTAFKYLIVIYGIMFVLNALGAESFGAADLAAFAGSVFIGTVLNPVLLPFIPGRAFSFKGFVTGLIWAVTVILINPLTLKFISYLIILPVISSYLSLNFTGCSTYTSPSGVNKEMRIALPVMIISLVCGLILLVSDMIIKIV